MSFPRAPMISGPCSSSMPRIELEPGPPFSLQRGERETEAERRRGREAGRQRAAESGRAAERGRERTYLRLQH